MQINKAFLGWAFILFAGVALPQERFGVFEGRGDIGAVLHPGSAEYDSARDSYLLSGSGENMWARADAFHFVWKRVSGDVTISADVSLLGAGKDPHRKAVLMVRQNLEADSAYVDAALHGDGLTSLQWRAENGDATHEIQANTTAPGRLRLSKRGDFVYMSVAAAGEQPRLAGGWTEIVLKEPFYVGIGVCAHNKDAVERAVFSKVELAAGPAVPIRDSVLYSTLETIAVASTDRRAVHVSRERLESPTWTRDGSGLLFNSQGKLVRLPASGGQATMLETGFASGITRYHSPSPDGLQVAFGHEASGWRRQPGLFVVPIGGGDPRRLIATTPSLGLGWSPDGKTIAFASGGKDRATIYTISAAGGQEKRLTDGEGPVFSADGQLIYFSSIRGGTRQIWRMRADGSGAEQVTADEFSNRSPQPSPDGRQLAYLSSSEGVCRPSAHGAQGDVAGGQTNPCAGKTARRAGQLGRTGLVARQPPAHLCQLPAVVCQSVAFRDAALDHERLRATWRLEGTVRAP